MNKEEFINSKIKLSKEDIIADYYETEKELIKKTGIEHKNQELKKQLEKYENPEDMTLMFMYCEEKAKDKIKELLQENQKYKEVIDKAIEYINKYESIKAYYEYIDEDSYDEYNYDEDFKKELLDILKEVE